MNRTYEEWLKYYENATKEQVIENMMLDIKEIQRLNNIIEELEKWLNEQSKGRLERTPYDEVSIKLKELKENRYESNKNN